MSTKTQESEVQTQNQSVIYPPWQPTPKELLARNEVLTAWIAMRIISDRSYNQFNGRTLYDFIDDGTKRWNGFIPEASPLLDPEQSRIFLNFTRNQIISYLVKVAMQRAVPKIKAVNKKTGMKDQKFSEVLEDMNNFSLDAENGDAKYLQIALEQATKGTAIVYEGYRKETQKTAIPVNYDPLTGEVTTKEGTRIIYDDCYQEIVPLEEFYITNPYEPNVQNQPAVIWKKLTTHPEAAREFSKYPNWKHVVPGAYTATGDVTTFYRDHVSTDLSGIQCEILRYYNRKDNKFIIAANGVVLYSGAFAFKDGRYPFAKYIYEPFDNFFFWGAHMPNKFMGEQDEINTYINMMNDKTYGSLLPYGLSSDLDDLIEDDVLQVNKIRKVGDVTKWKFDTLPGVSGGEMNMFQLIMGLARENSGMVSGAGTSTTPRGGKLPVRQVLLQQQESMQKLTYSMNFLEDGERERTILRVNHMLQFYSIPKIQKITGVDGEEIKQMVFRDIRLDNVQLSDGRKGTRMLKLIDGATVSDPMKKAQLQDDLSVTEMMGEKTDQPTEALAINVDTFYDYNLDVQIVKRSSYEQNKALNQASRHEYANWRISLQEGNLYPVNMAELVKYVDESYDLDSERFDVQQPQGPAGAVPQGAGNILAPGAPIAQSPIPGTAAKAPAPAARPTNPQSISKRVDPMGQEM